MPRAVSAPLKTKRGMGVVKQPATIAKLRATALNTSTVVTAAMANPDRPLTTKMKDFVRYWAQGETILSASIKAGYVDGGTYAYRLAKDPAILKLYEQERKAYEEASNMTRKRVVDGLLEAIDMAKMTSEPSSMIAGWREIAKMCGYYAPVEKKVSIDVNTNPVMERLNRLSDAELLKLMQEDAENIIEGEFREVTDDEDPE